MSPTGGEYLQVLRDMATGDMDRGDYVTMARVDRGFVVCEHILTFSGITIKRRVPKYACNATCKESEEDL